MSGRENDPRELPVAGFRETWDQTGLKEPFRLRMAQLAEGSHLMLPGAIVCGRNDGPTAVFLSTQHGDEWNGIAACHELYLRLDPEQLSGKVVFLAVANPLAFMEKRRTSSIDRVDMNRSWGTKRLRRPTEQTAALLLREVIPHADFVFDLHTAGPGEYLPCIGMLTHDRLPLALSFNLGCAFVRRYGNPAHEQGAHPGGLVPAAESLDIPAFLVELGRGRSIQHHHVELFADGALNFFKQVGMLPGEPSTIEQHVFENKLWIPAPHSGFFESLVALGEEVSEGQPVARVTALFSPRPTEVVSPRSGVIIYLRTEETLSIGESVAHVAF